VCHQRSVHAPLDASHAHDVAGANRLLGDIDSEGFDGANRANRLGGGVRLVVVHAQSRLVSQPLAGTGDDPDVSLDVAPSFKRKLEMP